jgi:putative transposase
MPTNQQLNTLYHCVYNLQYHLVLVTKYRRRCISALMLARLKTIFAATAEKWECQLIEFNGKPDHVHMLLSLNPTVQHSVFVNNLKTVSSRLIRKEFAQQLKNVYSKPVFWNRSYCILTCGGAPLSVIKQYIEQQAGTD